MALINFKERLHDRSNVLWTFLQQIVARGIVAIKFFVLARVLGPGAIGLIGIATLSISIIESLTDLGIGQAIVQHKRDLTNDQLSASWTSLGIRGCFISLIIFVGSPVLAGIFNAPQATGIFLWVSIIPIFRNFSSIGLSLALRDRAFRRTGIFQAVMAFVDLFCSLFFVLITRQVIGVIWGMVVAEFIKFIASHFVFPKKTKIDFRFSLIKNIIGYGKWIWGSTLLTFLLNNLDKIIIVRLLGITQLGLYQMAYKLAQLFIADIALAFSQYLFPTFSELYRSNKEEIGNTFYKVLWLFGAWVIITVVYSITIVPWLIYWFLGPAWVNAINLTKLLFINMSLGAIIAVFVSYLRAIGKPEVITFSTMLQLVVFGSFSILGIKWFGLNGVAYALAAGTMSATILMVIRTIKTYELIKPQTNNIIMFVTSVIILVILTRVNLNVTVLILSTIIYIGSVFMIYRQWRLA